MTVDNLFMQNSGFVFNSASGTIMMISNQVVEKSLWSRAQSKNHQQQNSDEFLYGWILSQDLKAIAKVNKKSV